MGQGERDTGGQRKGRLVMMTMRHLASSRVPSGCLTGIVVRTCCSHCGHQVSVKSQSFIQVSVTIQSSNTSVCQSITDSLLVNTSCSQRTVARPRQSRSIKQTVQRASDVLGVHNGVCACMCVCVCIQEPTIISPRDYRIRFRRAILSYFTRVPGTGPTHT